MDYTTHRIRRRTLAEAAEDAVRRAEAALQHQRLVDLLRHQPPVKCVNGILSPPARCEVDGVAIPWKLRDTCLDALAYAEADYVQALLDEYVAAAKLIDQLRQAIRVVNRYVPYDDQRIPPLFDAEMLR